MKMSVVIPAHNEEGCIYKTVADLCKTFEAENIDYEVLVVNDHSTDATEAILEELSLEFTNVTSVNNQKSGGFGYAIQTGLENFTGEAVCIMMADASDDPRDAVKYYRKLEEGYECVFGSRFTRNSRIVNYPKHKLVLNRLANRFIKTIFGFKYNDITNAFKCYRREVIEGVMPILACHFNLTVELPLKAIVRGYSYTIVPTNWYNRTTGVSKLKIKEMGSRYLFIVLYIFMEKLLTQGDYQRRSLPSTPIKDLPDYARLIRFRS